MRGRIVSSSEDGYSGGMPDIISNTDPPEQVYHVEDATDEHAIVQEADGTVYDTDGTVLYHQPIPLRYLIMAVLAASIALAGAVHLYVKHAVPEPPKGRAWCNEKVCESSFPSHKDKPDSWPCGPEYQFTCWFVIPQVTR